MKFNRDKSNGYPSSMEIEASAVMARDLSKIHELFKLISEIRRVPPGLVKNLDTWIKTCEITQEAGIQMRVAQLNYITQFDVIPNEDGSYTYILDTQFEFAPYIDFTTPLFMNNIQITVDVPSLDNCDLHVFETNTSVLIKYDTKIQLKKDPTHPNRYTAVLPGFHELKSNCINRLKLIFTSTNINHLPVTILSEYDYVFLKRRIAEIISCILSRYTCVRINNTLAIKYLPDEPNARIEYFPIDEPPSFRSAINESDILNSYSIFKNYDKSIIDNFGKKYINGIPIDDSLSDIINIITKNKEETNKMLENIYPVHQSIKADVNYDSFLYNNYTHLTKLQRDIIDFLYSINLDSTYKPVYEYVPIDHSSYKFLNRYGYFNVQKSVNNNSRINNVEQFKSDLCTLFSKITGYSPNILEHYLNSRRVIFADDSTYRSICNMIIFNLLNTVNVKKINVLKGADIIDEKKYDIIIEMKSEDRY